MAQVEIVVKTTEQGSQKVKSTRDNLKSLATAAAGATAVVAAMGVAAKKAFDLGKEGAQLAKIGDTFDALTISVGETSNIMLRDLRRATQGMVTDTGLMESANRFLAMGLAESGSEAARLSEIAVSLGAAMGKEAGPAMEEFALLLANQSIPRLDTFGISAGRVRVRIRELQEENEGMTRETAFMTAVMEEASDSMEKLGNKIPVDGFTQLEVAVENTTDALKVSLGEGLGPVLMDFSTGIELANELGRRLEHGTITMEAYASVLDGRVVPSSKAAQKEAMALIEATQDQEDAFQRNRAQVLQLEEAYKRYIKTGSAVTPVIEELTEITDEEREAMVAAGDAAFELGDAYENIAPGVQTLAGHLIDLQMETAAADAAMMKLSADTGPIFMDFLNQADEDTESFEEQMLSLTESEGANAEQLALLGVALGVFTEEQAQAALEATILQLQIEELAAAFVQGEITADQARSALERVTGGLGMTAAEAIHAEQEVSAAHQALAEIEGNYEAHINIRVTGIERLREARNLQRGIDRDVGLIGAQHGANFIVPPGFEGDSFPLMVSSGEHVRVTPANQVQNSTSFNLSVNTVQSSGSILADFDLMQALAAT